MLFPAIIHINMSGVFDDRNSGHLFSFYAAPPVGSFESGDAIMFNVQRTGASGLQQAMSYTLGAVYVASAVLFALSFVYLKRDRKASKNCESQ